MGVRSDCRHYSSRTVGHDEVVERCRLGVAAEMPFACPDDCVFFEDRPFRAQGFEPGSDEPEG